MKLYPKHYRWASVSIGLSFVIGGLLIGSFLTVYFGICAAVIGYTQASIAKLNKITIIRKKLLSFPSWNSSKEEREAALANAEEVKAEFLELVEKDGEHEHITAWLRLIENRIEYCSDSTFDDYVDYEL